MSIKEQVILEFIVDDEQLGMSIDNLAQLAGADQKLAEKLKQSAAAFSERRKAVDQSVQSQKTFETSTGSTIQSVEELSASMRASLGNIAKGGLKELSFEIRRGIVEELQKAGISVKQFKAAFGQTFESNKKATRSLSQELKLAKNELARLATTPGVDPLKLKEAGERAGLLASQLKNVNQTINAFNPDVKLASVNALGSGLFASFNAAQGALQTFGAESEQVNGLMAKFAGLLGFSSGITQLIQLKDAWANVKLTLGTATEGTEKFVDTFKEVGELSGDVKALADGTEIAKGAVDKLKVAKLADAAASDTAAAANRALALSMPVVAIGALVVGMVALIGYLITLDKETDETADSLERLFEKKNQSKELQNEIEDVTLKLQVARGEVSQLSAELKKNAQDSAKELAPLLVERDKLNEKIKQEANQIKNTTALMNAASASSRESGAIQAAQAAKRLQQQKLNLAAFEQEMKQLEQNIELIKSRNKQESKLIRQTYKNKNKKEEIEREQELTEAIATRVGNEERALELAITSLGLSKDQQKALQELGFEGIKLSETYLTLNNTQVQALAALNDYAKGSYESLRNFFKQAQDELKKQADVISVALGQTATDLNNEMFEKQDALKDLIADILDGVDQIASNLAAINEINLASALDKETSFYQGKKDSELKNKRLTEEQKAAIEDKYNTKIAQAKEDAAKKQRQADTIQLGIDQSLAIGKLATTTSPPSPAFFIGLAVILSTFAAQIAAVRSAPLPKYKDGVEYIEGPGTTTSDSILARLSKGERVMSAATNEAYYPALSAIHNREVPATEVNRFVQEYRRDFTITKNITRNIVPSQANMNDEAIARRLALQMQMGMVGAYEPSEYDKLSTDYLRIIAETVSKERRLDNIRRGKS